MHPALRISITGLEAQNTDIRTISNNLANVSTTGFKKDRTIFQDLMYQNIRQPGADSSQSSQLPSGLMLGTGVMVTSTQKMHSQGSMVQTENPLDLAVNGRGFFQIMRPDGTTAYTRDGHFQVNSQGQLVTPSGYQLVPSITIPNNAQSISIGQDGTISALIAGTNSPTQIGSLQLVDFINPSGLQPMGENAFLETAASGSPQIATPGQQGMGNLIQGSLESSNVNVVEELVRMIETQRAYEMNARSVETVNKMLEFVTQVL